MSAAKKSKLSKPQRELLVRIGANAGYRLFGSDELLVMRQLQVLGLAYLDYAGATHITQDGRNALSEVAKLRRKLQEHEWLKVRRIMAQAIRGQPLTTDDYHLIKLAYALEPRRYSDLHSDMKAEAMRDMNPLARDREVEK